MVVFTDFKVYPKATQKENTAIPIFTQGPGLNKFAMLWELMPESLPNTII